MNFELVGLVQNPHFSLSVWKFAYLVRPLFPALNVRQFDYMISKNFDLLSQLFCALKKLIQELGIVWIWEKRLTRCQVYKT